MVKKLFALVLAVSSLGLYGAPLRWWPAEINAPLYKGVELVKQAIADNNLTQFEVVIGIGFAFAAAAVIDIVLWIISKMITRAIKKKTAKLEAELAKARKAAAPASVVPAIHNGHVDNGMPKTADELKGYIDTRIRAYEKAKTGKPAPVAS